MQSLLTTEWCSEGNKLSYICSASSYSSIRSISEWLLRLRSETKGISFRFISPGCSRRAGSECTLQQQADVGKLREVSFSFLLKGIQIILGELSRLSFSHVRLYLFFMNKLERWTCSLKHFSFLCAKGHKKKPFADSSGSWNKFWTQHWHKFTLVNLLAISWPRTMTRN